MSGDGPDGSTMARTALLIAVLMISTPVLLGTSETVSGKDHVIHTHPPVVVQDPLGKLLGSGYPEATIDGAISGSECIGSWKYVPAADNTALLTNSAVDPVTALSVVAAVITIVDFLTPPEEEPEMDVKWELTCSATSLQVWANGYGNFFRRIVIQGWQDNAEQYVEIAECDYDGILNTECPVDAFAEFSAAGSSTTISGITSAPYQIPNHVDLCVNPGFKAQNEPQYDRVLPTLFPSTEVMMAGDRCDKDIAVSWGETPGAGSALAALLRAVS